MKLKKRITGHDHDKYITTPKFNNLAAGDLNAKLAQADLVTKKDFDAKLKKITEKNKKIIRIINSDKTKHLLVENELKKVQKFDMTYFKGRNYFEGNDGVQNLLVF